MIVRRAQPRLSGTSESLEHEPRGRRLQSGLNPPDIGSPDKSHDWGEPANGIGPSGEVRWSLDRGGIVRTKSNQWEEVFRKLDGKPSHPNDPQSDEFRRAATLLSALVATWSYSTEQGLANLLALVGIPDNSVYGVHSSNVALLVDTVAHVVHDPKRELAIVSFRGTELNELTDYLTNLDVTELDFPKNGTPQTVHLGFYRAMMSVWYGTLVVLERLHKDHGLKTVLLTGHSLGGALASLAASTLFLPGVDGFQGLGWLRSRIAGLYTFGQPMAGNRAFCAACDRSALGIRTFRHVFGKDVVPRFPPRTTSGFDHFGQEYRGVLDGRGWSASEETGQAGSAIVSLSLAIGDFFSQRLRGSKTISKHLGLSPSLSDHIPQNYVDCSRDAESPRAFP